VSRDLKLFGREIIFEEFPPMWSRYLNVTDGRIDGRTDDMQSHNRAICVASRSKKSIHFIKAKYSKCRPSVGAQPSPPMIDYLADDAAADQVMQQSGAASDQ